MVNKKEVDEARAVALEVLNLLDGVEKMLKSARGWGIYDILGGGFFASMIKHGKIDRAESLLRQVQSHLIRLQKELGDIDLSLVSSVQVSGFERFMDIAFDNVLSDWITQSRINDSLNEVMMVKSEIRRVIAALDRIEREYC